MAKCVGALLHILELKKNVFYNKSLSIGASEVLRLKQIRIPLFPFWHCFPTENAWHSMPAAAAAAIAVAVAVAVVVAVATTIVAIVAVAIIVVAVAIIVVAVAAIAIAIAVVVAVAVSSFFPSCCYFF